MGFISKGDKDSTSILEELIKNCRAVRDEWDWFEENDDVGIESGEFEQHLNNNSDAIEAMVNTIRKYDESQIGSTPSTLKG